MIEAGRLNKRVTLERATSTTNEYGEHVETWQPVGTVWAGIEPVSGREVELAKSFSASVSHKVTIRYQPGLDSTVRVNYGGRVFSVDAVLDEREAHEKLTLYCTEQGA